MVQAYWLIGKRIVEEEQQGEAKAAYGKGVIKKSFAGIASGVWQRFLGAIISKICGRFYLAISNFRRQCLRKSESPQFQLSWSHYQMLLRVENKEERAFYEIEATQNNWSLRELKRQFDSALYLRLALSTDKEGHQKISTRRTSHTIAARCCQRPVYFRISAISKNTIAIRRTT
jgi:hypothetical protein